MEIIEDNIENFKNVGAKNILKLSKKNLRNRTRNE
jgi:hypothetical protein